MHSRAPRRGPSRKVRGLRCPLPRCVRRSRPGTLRSSRLARGARAKCRRRTRAHRMSGEALANREWPDEVQRRGAARRRFEGGARTPRCIQARRGRSTSEQVWAGRQRLVAHGDRLDRWQRQSSRPHELCGQTQPALRRGSGARGGPTRRRRQAQARPLRAGTYPPRAARHPRRCPPATRRPPGPRGERPGVSEPRSPRAPVARPGPRTRDARGARRFGT